MAATTLRGDLTMHPLFVKRAAAAKSSCSLLLALLLHLYHVCMTTQLKDLAARYGLEAIVGFFGAISTFKAPTAIGGPHIGFSVIVPYLSNLIPPGCSRGACLGVACAGTGGPLTTALKNPEQASQWATTCLKAFASQGCIAHHEHLQVRAAAAHAGGGGRCCPEQEASLLVLQSHTH
jgi:hypothetical protein